LQQAQGSSFIANYSVVFLQTIGIKDTYQITVLLYVVNLAAAGLAFYAADRLGRRYLLLGAACVMAACMYAVAGITGYDSDPESIKGALACLFIWQFAQALGWSSWYVHRKSVHRRAVANILSASGS